MKGFSKFTNLSIPQVEHHFKTREINTKDFDKEGDAKFEKKKIWVSFNEKHLRFETSMTKKLSDFELDMKIKNGKQLIFLQAHDRVINGGI